MRFLYPVQVTEYVEKRPEDSGFAAAVGTDAVARERVP